MSEGATDSETVPQTSEEAGQLELWTELAALERERIASRNRMTSVMEAGLGGLDAANQRHFEFQRERLQRDDTYRNRQLSHIVRFAWAAVGITVSVVGVLLFLILWGSAEQREAAFTLMGVGGALLTGVLIGRLSRRK